MGNRSARESGVALILSFIMVMSMVAIGGIAMSPAGAAVDGPTMDEDGLTDEFEEELTEDIELQTQSGDEVTVAEELETELEGVDSDETVEVFVRLDEAKSELLEGETLTTDSDGESLDTDDPQVTAELTQMPLKEYAAETDGVEVLNEFWIANGVLLEVEESLVDDLTTIDGVDELHPNYEIEHPDPEPAAVEHSEDDTADMHYTYGLEQLNVPDAWDEFGTKGEDVQIAIVDTGINADHEAFPHYNESNWAAFGFDGTPLHEEEPAEFGEPFDFNGHGTHVAGTAAGNTSATDQPAIGVAPEADILAINVFPDPDGGTTLAAIVAGMQHAVEEGTDVSNFSLGGAGFGDIYVEVIQNAKAKGTHVVSSSGNAGPGSTGTPANVYNSTAVGATNYLEAVAGFSTGAEIDTDEDWGPIAPDTWPDEYVTPDVSAPGVAVLSAYVPGPFDDYDDPDAFYAELQGTSMAAPHVTGVTALLMSYDESLEPNDVKETLEETATKPTPDQISQEVLWDAEEVSPETATDLHFDDERDARYGYGIVDAYSALASVDEQTIEGDILNEAGDPVQDRGYPAYWAEVDDEFPDPAYPGFVPDGSGPTVTIDDTDRHSYAVDSTFDFDVTEGSYELDVTGAFGHVNNYSVEVGAGEEPTVILDRQFEVEPVSQPQIAIADEQFFIDTNVAHLENITVDINETLSSPYADADNVSVSYRHRGDYIDIQLNETIEVNEDPTIEYPFSLNVTANENVTSGDVALDKTFEGIGESETVTTETVILDEEPEPEPEPDVPVVISDFDPVETAFIGDQIAPGEVTILNTGNETWNATVAWYEENLGYFSEEFELEPDETETYAPDLSFVDTGDPVPWSFAFDVGDVAHHSFFIEENEEEFIRFETEIVAGEISGTVEDISSDEPLAAIDVWLEDETGQPVDDMTTSSTGEYVLYAETPGEYEIVADAPSFSQATETIHVEDHLEPIERDLEVGTQPTFQFDFEAGETYSFGIPGPIEGGTLGEILPSEMEGVVYTHDAGENEWVQVGTDYEVEPREAFVIVADESQEKVTVDFAGTPSDTDGIDSSPSSGVDIEQGWNLITPSELAEAEEDAFGLLPANVTDTAWDAASEPISTMVPETGAEKFNPFSGYWVWASDEGEAGSNIGEDMTLDKVYERINIDYERLSGNVVSNVDGEGVVDADLSVGGTPFQVNTAGASMAGDVDIVTEDGAYSLPPLPTEQYNIVSADADGFEATTFNTSWDEHDLDDEIELEEKVYYDVEITDVDAEGILDQGDEFSVTYELENVGTQAGNVIVDTIISEDVEDRPLAARLREGASGLHSTKIALAAGEEKTVTVDSEVPVGFEGTLDIGVFAERGSDVAAGSVNVTSLEFTDQVLGTTEDGNDAVLVENVVGEEGDSVDVAVGDEIVGYTELEEETIGEDIIVEIDNLTGFPGVHDAYLFDGDQVPHDDAIVFDAELGIDDQSYDDSTHHVMVNTSDLQPERVDHWEQPYQIVLHEGEPGGPILGSAYHRLTGEQSDVEVHLDEPIDEDTEVVAMLHYFDGDADYAAGPPIPMLDEGQVGVVTDNATIDVDREPTVELWPQVIGEGDDSQSVFVNEVVPVEGYEDDFLVLTDNESAEEGEEIIDYKQVSDLEGTTDGEFPVDAVMDIGDNGPGIYTVGLYEPDEDGESPNVSAPREYDGDGVSDGAHLFEADVEFDDVTNEGVDDNGPSVEVQTANLYDGFANETNFTAGIWSESSDDIIGLSDSLQGENDNLTVDVEALEDGDQLYAVLGLETTDGEPFYLYHVFDGTVLPFSDGAEVTINE